MFWISVVLLAVVSVWACAAGIWLLRRKRRKGKCEGCPYRGSDGCERKK